MGTVSDIAMEQLLSSYRTRLGLSLQECAKRSGITAPQLSAFEHGYGRLKPAQLFALCDTLYTRSLELERNVIPAAKRDLQEIRDRAVSA